MTGAQWLMAYILAGHDVDLGIISWSALFLNKEGGRWGPSPNRVDFAEIQVAFGRVISGCHAPQTRNANVVLKLGNLHTFDDAYTISLLLSYGTAGKSWYARNVCSIHPVDLPRC
jgi:hypothetical protein